MDKFDFEASIKELEEIVKKLETGSVSLDESIVLYQRGLKIYGACYNRLQEAEKLIVKLVDENQE